ncbi:helix-turn-helix domain-containing protein [Pseudomonas sp. zbq_18]|uniref:helix-turn-helix domain-containing protein n=1 Tax=Pseudomonas sp. zbq_18 TaxID=3367251 RepID=UPI00370AC892
MPNENPNLKTSNTQRAMIRRHLEAGNSLTALQALNHYGCARLASRIDELRQAGMNIETHWLQVQNRQGKLVRVAEYRLAANDAAQAGVVA